MHLGGRDSGNGPTGPPNEGGLFRNGACHVRLGGRCRHVLVHDVAVGNQDDGDRGGDRLVEEESDPLPPRDAAQGDQWKTVMNGNNYGSGRALDDENVDDDDNGSGGGGPALMIDDEDDRAGVATGGDDEGNCLRSRLI